MVRLPGTVWEAVPGVIEAMLVTAADFLKVRYSPPTDTPPHTTDPSISSINTDVSLTNTGTQRRVYKLWTSTIKGPELLLTEITHILTITNKRDRHPDAIWEILITTSGHTMLKRGSPDWSLEGTCPSTKTLQADLMGLYPVPVTTIIDQTLVQAIITHFRHSPGQDEYASANHQLFMDMVRNWFIDCKYLLC